MLKIAVLAVASAFTGSAYAADLPVKAPPPVQPVVVPSWTGFYIGGHAGLGWRSLNGTLADPNGVILGLINPSSGSQNGAVGGFHAGYNWQFNGAWVAGIEGDIDATSLSNHARAGNFVFAPGGPPVPNTAVSLGSDAQWLASIRGRLGFVGWANTLFYATGGAAWAHTKFDAQETNSPPTFVTNFLSSATLTNTKSGWVAGGGAETMVTPRILVRAEYLYYGLSSNESASAFLLPNPGAFPRAFNYSWSTNSIQVVRAGLSYKF